MIPAARIQYKVLLEGFMKKGIKNIKDMCISYDFTCITVINNNKCHKTSSYNQRTLPTIFIISA